MTDVLLGLILLFTALDWYEHSTLVEAARRWLRKRWAPVRQWAKNKRTAWRKRRKI